MLLNKSRGDSGIFPELLNVPFFCHGMVKPLGPTSIEHKKLKTCSGTVEHLFRNSNNM